MNTFFLFWGRLESLQLKLIYGHCRLANKSGIHPQYNKPNVTLWVCCNLNKSQKTLHGCVTALTRMRSSEVPGAVFSGRLMLYSGLLKMGRLSFSLISSMKMRAKPTWSDMDSLAYSWEEMARWILGERHDKMKRKCRRRLRNTQTHTHRGPV